MTFEEVYARFRGPVWRLARRLTGNQEEALDATQEIFLRVWRGLPSFRGEARLSTWVFQVAWNYLRGAARRRAARPRLVAAGGGGDGEELVLRIPDEAPDPERQAGAREQLGRLAAALERLPEHQRVVVWLRDGEGLSYDEIADVLDVPIGTVRSRLARARGALKEMVQGG